MVQIAQEMGPGADHVPARHPTASQRAMASPTSVFNWRSRAALYHRQGSSPRAPRALRRRPRLARGSAPPLGHGCGRTRQLMEAERHLREAMSIRLKAKRTSHYFADVILLASPGCCRSRRAVAGRQRAGARAPRSSAPLFATFGSPLPHPRDCFREDWEGRSRPGTARRV